MVLMGNFKENEIIIVIINTTNNKKKKKKNGGFQCIHTCICEICNRDTR